MEIIFTLLSCLISVIDYTILRRIALIAAKIFTMPGRVNMLNISRRTEAGGSYRNIQRVYTSPFDWLKIHWFFIHHHFFNKEGVIIMAGDEVVVSKSGKSTYGIGKFFSSVFKVSIPSVSFQVLSLISVNDEKSYPVYIRQMMKPLQEEASGTVKKSPEKGDKKEKRGRGRPKGSKNKNRKNVELSPGLIFLKEMIDSVLKTVGTDISLIYFVYDGASGNNKGVRAVLRCGMEIVGKLKYNSALYFPYKGEYSGRGPRRKYGDKIDYDNIPSEYLKKSEIEDGIRSDFYQMEMLHKLFACRLNILIIVKTNLITDKKGHIVLFSTDLNLSWDKIYKYYSLRFQIEFNFRDAKQFWGLEDFMNIKEQTVLNAANISMLMVNISHALRKISEFSGMSILDLKTWFRAGKYVRETLKLLPESPDPVFIRSVIDRMAALGRINQVKEPV